MSSSDADLLEAAKPKSTRDAGQTIDVIIEYAAQGMTRQEIADRLEKGYDYVRFIVKRNNIKVTRESRGVTRRPEIDVLLTGEYTPEQIAMHVKPLKYSDRGSPGHVTRERIRRYINLTGQYKTFTANRNAFKERKKLERQQRNEALVHALKQYLDKRLEKENFAARMTVMYIQNTQLSSCGVPLRKVMQLAGIYGNAVESCGAPTERQMAEKSELSTFNVSWILKKLGLKPFDPRMTKCKPRVATPKEKKDAIKRSYAYREYSTTDIAYFLKIPDYVVRRNMTFYFDNTGKRHNMIKKFVGDGSVYALTHHMASEVYELEDTGFSREDIVAFYGDKRRAAEYALDHRREIEPKITGLLDILYPETRHENPYI